MSRLGMVLILVLFLVAVYTCESIILFKSINEFESDYELPDDYITSEQDIEDFKNGSAAGNDAISIFQFLTFSPPQLGNPLLAWIFTPMVIIISVIIIWLVVSEIHAWIPFLPGRKE